ncbi:heme o synthase [Nemorincola caseinilytica]|uniref:Protoheme IX farnesyltransferase n=1 Tax=Nemorincola caseinilytica TaxID=2054315 RepID=A0ABP8NQ30_9BACT
MLQQETIQAGGNSNLITRIKDYNQLLKPNLSGMVVFSSVIGYLMAPNISFSWGDIGMWLRVIVLFIGGMMVTGGANTINQILERDSDRLMKRTRTRPLPDGRLGDTEAWIFATVMGVTGAITLAFFFHPLAGLLSFFSLLLYAFVYTPMKKIHPVAVFIGAIPGALPPLIGWVAATGSIDAGGLVLFSLQFFWQFPHFWAIAWVAFDDYANAGIRMLPTREKESRFTAIQCIMYSLVLIPMAMLPNMFGMTGNIGTILSVACGVMYLAASIAFYIRNDHRSARRVMFASFIYLPVVLLALVIDKL